MAHVDIPEAVRFAARHLPMAGSGLPPPPGVELVHVEGGIVVITTMSCMVDVPELSPGRAERAVEQVRTALRAAGKTWAYWQLEAERLELARALKAYGLVENFRPPWEARFTALALVHDPEAGDAAGVTARRVETLAEHHQADDVTSEVYGHDAGTRAKLRERAPSQFAYEQSPDAVSRTYIAYLDGEAAGVASVLFAPTVVNLLGGSVIPRARGRGVYRALVAARWRDAVERGTPALTVQAGAMSRPILEGVGFVPVGGIEVLLDDLEQLGA